MSELEDAWNEINGLVEKVKRLAVEMIEAELERALTTEGWWDVHVWQWTEEDGSPYKLTSRCATALMPAREPGHIQVVHHAIGEEAPGWRSADGARPGTTTCAPSTDGDDGAPAGAS